MPRYRGPWATTMVAELASRGAPLTSASICVKDGAYWLTGDAEAGTLAVAKVARELGVQAVLRHENAYAIRYSPARATEDTGLLLAAYLRAFVAKAGLLQPPAGHLDPADPSILRLGASELLEDEDTGEAVRL